MLSRYIIFILILLFCLSTSMYSQNANCNPTSVDTSQYTGTAFFNYGSTSRAKSQKYRITAAIGQTLIGFHESAGYSSSYGFYSRYLLPPFGLKVKATQGELLDRIQLSWEIDALGPSSNEGFNIYRDGVFLATVGPKIRNYNDFNVIAGVAYTYTVRGLNAYGEGSPANALGFQVPNGVVTGWIRTVNGSPVPDAVVSLMPMQGFSLKFGTMDKAFAMKDSLHPFFPAAGKDWTLTFWIKTDSARANASLIKLSPSALYVRTINSASGKDGVEITTSQEGAPILSGMFADSTKKGWHHIALTFEGAGDIGRLYIDGVLIAQAPMSEIATVDSLTLGNTVSAPGWAGRMDELRIYHKQLTELDFGEVMEGTASSQTPFLSHYWKMDEELGERSYDIKQRHKLYFCGTAFDKDRPAVRTAGKTNSQGYYRIESASYGTGTTFLAEPEKDFYMHRSLKFNRNDMNYATLPDFALTKKATIEIVVNNASITGTQSLLSKKWGSNEFRFYLEPNGQNNEIKVYLNGNIRSYGNLGNGFQHLALTIDSLTGVVQGYRNGISVGSHVFAGVTGNWSDTTKVWVVGARDDGGTKADFFNGLVDEVAVYDTTLSAATILSHVNQTRISPEKGLRVYFPFDEGNGNRLGNVGSVFLGFGSLLGAEWSSFAPNQVTQPHIFSPNTRQVTLNPSITSVDQVDFIDRSTVAVSGFVRYKNTDCFANRVEILVNGSSFKPQIFTDSTGRFTIDFDPGTTAMLTPKFKDHKFVPAFWEVTNVNSPIAGILFHDITTRKIQGQIAGGLCRKPIISGESEDCRVTVRSQDGCYERTQVITEPDGKYEFDPLPPLEVTIAITKHNNPTIYKDFQNQGGRTIDLTKKDSTGVDFIYIAPPAVDVQGLEDYFTDCKGPNGQTLKDVDGNPLIILAEFQTVKWDVIVYEQYGTGQLTDDRCPLDSAYLSIDNTFDLNYDFLEQKKDTLRNKKYDYNFVAAFPTPDAPYMKIMQITATANGRTSVFTRRALITGIIKGTSKFTTVSPMLPNFILRDPPGDGSYAFMEKGETICNTLSTENSVGGGPYITLDIFTGSAVELNIPFAPKQGVKALAGVTTEFSLNLVRNNSTSMDYCITTNERISTDDGDLVVGDKTSLDGGKTILAGNDVYVGTAFNFIFSDSKEVRFNDTTCMVQVQDVTTIQSDTFATTYMYSEYNLENNVIRYLDTLIKRGQDPNGVNSTSKQRWLDFMTLNKEAKAKAKFKKNLTWDAGIQYEYSETRDTAQQVEKTLSESFEGLLGFALSTGATGATTAQLELKTGAKFEGSFSLVTDQLTQRGTTVGYVLKDDDPLDTWTMDVKDDPLFKTPVFDVRAGQTSCPWEVGTSQREGVELISVDGNTRDSVPSNGIAAFKFLLTNRSPTFETWTYGVTAGPESNPNGAIVKLNGAALDHNVLFAIPWGTQVPITITVERGPQAYTYKGLEVVLFSLCHDARANGLGIAPDDDPYLYSAVYLNVNFDEPCSEVDISFPQEGWVIKPDAINPATQNLLPITVSGYDKKDTDLVGIRLQYRPTDGNGAWINITDGKPDYIPKDSLGDIFEVFNWNTSGTPPLADGAYEIRALSVCSGGPSNKEGYSHIIKGRIERQPPSLIGTPEPADGVFHVGDEISFTFNKDINCNKIIEADLTQPNNLGLYDASTGQLIDVEVTCRDNKIILVPKFQNKIFENRILRAELNNIQDKTGNKLIKTTWEFYVDRNELAWLTDSIEMTKYEDESKTITAKIHNRGGYPVPYSIQSVPNWVHVFPDRGTLVANEIQEIQFRMDSLVPIGLLSDSIILRTETGLNPFFIGGEEVLNLKARVVCKPPPWILGSGSFNASAFSFSMNYTVELNIEGTMSTDREDIVGAYVKDELRGIAKVQYNSVLKKYVAFLTVYSNVATGETVEFQIWDASKCFLYANTMESFAFVADGIIGTPLVPQVLRTDSKLLRRIYIHPGWNWISMNLGLSNRTVTGALKSLKNPGEGLIKNQTTFSQYSAAVKQWFGTLDTISPYSMYQLKTIAEDSILMVGVPINVSQPIPVKAGWNWIGYLPQYSLPIGAALASLTPTQGDIIKSQLGFAQYVTGSGWIGNLNFLSAPNGYLLKLTNPGVLIYPNVVNLHERSGLRSDPLLVHEDPSRTDIDKISGSERLSNHWHIDPSRYEYSMNAVAIVVNGGGEKNMLNEGDEVGTFVGSEFRGGGKAIYVPSIDAYVLFITTYANKEGETLTFKFFDASENKEFFLMEKTAFKINSLWGGVDTPQPLHLALPTSSEDWNIEGNHVTVYPNPFTNNFAIHIQSGNTSEVNIEFKDVHGQELDSKKLYLKPGENVVEWNVKNHLPGGVYFITVRGLDKTYTLKVLHIK